MLIFIAGILDKIKKYKPKQENIMKLFAFLKKEELKQNPDNRNELRKSL